MRQASKRIPESAEKTVRDIRRATRRHHSAEEKIRIVLEGLRGEDSIAELCRKEGINQNLLGPSTPSFDHLVGAGRGHRPEYARHFSGLTLRRTRRYSCVTPISNHASHGSRQLAIGGRVRDDCTHKRVRQSRMEVLA